MWLGRIWEFNYAVVYEYYSHDYYKVPIAHGDYSNIYFMVGIFGKIRLYMLLLIKRSVPGPSSGALLNYGNSKSGLDGCGS